MTPSKREGQQEGSKTASRAESKNHAPQGPPGSPSFTAFDPDSLKWGRAGAEEGCYQDGWRNKVRIQAGGGPEVSHMSSRLTDSRVTHREGGPPPDWRARSTEKRPPGSSRSSARRRKVSVRRAPGLPPPNRISAASGYLGPPDRGSQNRGTPQEKPASARGAGQAEAGDLQDKESERRERNVLQGREQEPQAPKTPRIAPIHGLRPRLPKMGRS